MRLGILFVKQYKTYTMVLGLNGTSEKGAYVWSNLGYLICLSYLFRSTAVTNLTFFGNAFTRAQRQLCNHLI